MKKDSENDHTYQVTCSRSSRRQTRDARHQPPPSSPRPAPAPPPPLYGLVPPDIRVIHVIEQERPPSDTRHRVPPAAVCIHPSERVSRPPRPRTPEAHKPPASMSWSPRRLRQEKINLRVELRTGCRTPHFFPLREKCEKPVKIHGRKSGRHRAELECQRPAATQALVILSRRKPLKTSTALECQRSARPPALENCVTGANLEDLRHTPDADLYLECEMSMLCSAVRCREEKDTTVGTSTNCSTVLYTKRK